ncbi:hypothetical protein HYU16_03365 [Candidatus Woesearchaeota archaeon]|nr:hypothetical protein [Candidatus Woesearchaeota archaeon]
MTSETLQELQKESSAIDVHIKKENWKLIVQLLGMVFLYAGLVAFFGLKHLRLAFVLGGIGILFFGLSFILRSELSQRQKIAYVLNKIADGIEKNNLKRNYLKFLYKEALYDEEDYVKKSDNIFVQDELKTENFYKNLNRLALRLNSALAEKRLQNINAKRIRDLSEGIYYRKKDFVKLGNVAKDLYQSEQKFPDLFDLILNFSRKLWTVKLVKTVFLVSILYLFLNVLTARGVIPSRETLWFGFFTISAVIVGLVYRKN